MNFFIFFTLLLLQHLNFINTLPSSPITALYAFGDSTVDSGNNNYIPTLFQSNHPPYGLNFPAKLPTGRFSDGKLATDFLVSFLRLKPTLPAYLDPKVKPVDLLTGVSFASAGGGFDDQTARLSMSVNLEKQWNWFEETVEKMKSVVGDLEANRVIKNGLFVISAGTNDMIYNVYDNVLGRLVSVSDYQDHLLTILQAFIQRLHDAGAQRIAVAGLPPIGCLPVQVTLGNFGHHRFCKEHQNIDSQIYNQKLQNLILRINHKLPHSKIHYLDIYSPLIDMITHPTNYGLKETLKGCCGSGIIEAGPLCEPMSGTCKDASNHLFFDSVHPSQKAYSVIADFAVKNLLPLL